jgi:hypothetical protein
MFTPTKDRVTAAARGRDLSQPNLSKFIYLLVAVGYVMGMCTSWHQVATIDIKSERASTRPSSVVRGRDPGEPPSYDYDDSGFFKGLDPHKYQPGSVEQYILNHPHELNYDNPKGAKVCPIWKNETTTEDIYQSLHTYMDELRQYNELLDAFTPINDLRRSMSMNLDLDDESNNQNHKEVCQAVQLHPDGLRGIFKSSGQLSYTGAAGFIEPLLPPLRHPINCLNTFGKKKNRLNLDYLVHDFQSMCHRLKKTSRIVLIDMGASLSFFVDDQERRSMPAIFLMDLFTKFGMPFDHIYAYEVTPTKPETVFSKVPPEYMSAYHWINVGVSADKESRLNPLYLILNDFHEDDLVIVKLDIDTPEIELALAHQLLENPKLHKLVDHFYFEHHVKLKELLGYWGSKTNGTVQESMELFMNLRKKGVAAHSWV